MAYIRQVRRNIDGQQYLVVKGEKTYILQKGDISYLVADFGGSRIIELSLEKSNYNKTITNKNEPTSEPNPEYEWEEIETYGDNEPIQITIEHTGNYSVVMKANGGYYRGTLYHGEEKRFTRSYQMGQVITGNFGACGFSYSNEAFPLTFDGVTAKGGGDYREKQVTQGQEIWGYLTLVLPGYIDNEGTFYESLPSDAVEV